MRSGVGIPGSVTLSMSQRDIISALVMLAMERALGMAALLCTHEDRTVVTKRDLEAGLKREILLGCGASLERAVTLVAQGRHDECTPDDAAFLREAVEVYGTQAREEEEDDDEQEAGEDQSAEEEEENGASPCPCRYCEEMRVVAPTLWDPWSAAQPETSLGRAAVLAVERLV